jgi:hypothetical protein
MRWIEKYFELLLKGLNVYLYYYRHFCTSCIFIKYTYPAFFDVGPNPFRDDALRIRHGLSHLLKPAIELIFMANIEG